MGVCSSKKIDSNNTGLRVCEEDCIGVAKANPTWELLLPNSYNSFGAKYDAVSRTTINPSRQNKKGAYTNIQAEAGFEIDLTMDNMTKLLQGFFFANAISQPNTKNISTTIVADFDGIASTFKINVPLPNGIKVGDKIFVSGFKNKNNNGCKVVTDVSNDSLKVEGLLLPESSNNAYIIKVGFDCKCSITANVNDHSTIELKNNTSNFIVGEWVYLTGLAIGNVFVRIASVVNKTTYKIDKSSLPLETVTNVNISVYQGTIIRNEQNPDKIVKKSYQFERTLGNDANGVQAEYIIGAVANELTIDVPSADKVKTSLAYVATGYETRTGLQGLKPGNRVNPIYDEEAINTSVDFSRLSMNVMRNGIVQKDLFMYATDLKLSIKNNVSANNAIGVFGAIDVTAGIFDVSCSITAYFTTVESQQAIKNNEDVAIDMIILKNNKGLIFDLPLVSSNGGEISVALNEPVTVPLENNAAESQFGYTLLFMQFDYLPS